jgi:O-antigen/teichoic acid export membrane protein
MGLGGAVLAGIGVPAIIKLWGVIDLFHFRLPELRPRLSLYRSHFLRSLLVDGGLLLLLTTAFAGIFQVDKIFLGILLGPKPVAEFSILGKIFLLSAGIFALLLRSLWPAYCEAFHRKDFGWIRRWLSLTLVAGVVINCVTGIVLCSLKKPLYKLWLGDAATVPGYAVILSFTACFLMFSWMTAHGAVLNAARILKPQLVVLGTHTILTIVIMPVLITRWKTSGAACAPFLAGLLTSAWGYPFLVRKYVFSCE